MFIDRYSLIDNFFTNFNYFKVGLKQENETSNVLTSTPVEHIYTTKLLALSIAIEKYVYYYICKYFGGIFCNVLFPEVFLQGNKL